MKTNLLCWYNKSEAIGFNPKKPDLTESGLNQWWRQSTDLHDYAKNLNKKRSRASWKSRYGFCTLYDEALKNHLISSIISQSRNITNLLQNIDPKPQNPKTPYFDFKIYFWENSMKKSETIIEIRQRRIAVQKKIIFLPMKNEKKKQ